MKTFPNTLNVTIKFVPFYGPAHTNTNTHKPEWIEPLMHKPIRHTESESLLPSSLQQDYRSLKMYFYKARSGIVLHKYTLHSWVKSGPCKCQFSPFPHVRKAEDPSSSDTVKLQPFASGRAAVKTKHGVFT